MDRESTTHDGEVNAYRVVVEIHKEKELICKT
jgi:hypothetical protein